MKYFILFITLPILFLMWCNQKADHIQNPIITGDFFTPVPKPQNIFLWGSLSVSSIIISWLNSQFVFSWNTLIYSGFFTIKNPKDLKNWIYTSRIDSMNSIYFEQVILTNEDVKRHFNISLSKIISSNQQLSEKELCKNEYMEWVLSKSSRIKIIQGKNIYITDARFQISGPDMDPRISREIQFCFVNSDMLYNFSISNYDSTYMNQIINSLTFY